MSGEEIRAGLRARTGEEVPGFVLASRHRSGEAARRVRQVGAEFDLGQFGARSAWAPLPPAMAHGGIDFVSWTNQSAWLVCSGAGPAPWPQPEHHRRPGGSGGFFALRSQADRLPSPEDAMFARVVDDQGQRYQLKMSSSAASNPGSERERWDLRLYLTPTPSPAVQWLRFETRHGVVTASLNPPAASATASRPKVMEVAEFYLYRQLHNHAWLHLLDPRRPLARLGVIAEALVAAR